VDADACPVRRETERVARHFGVEVRYFANSSQVGIGKAGAHHRLVEGPDGADFAILAVCSARDVVVTDDVGLATIALSRGAAVISSRGKRYRNAEMATRLYLRHLARKARRAGFRTRGPAPFTHADRRSFAMALGEAIREKVGRRENTFSRVR